MYRRSYVPFSQFLQTGKTTLQHIIKTDTEHVTDLFVSLFHRHSPVPVRVSFGAVLLTRSVSPPPPQHRSIQHPKAPSGCPFRASIPNCLAPTNLLSILLALTFREFNTNGIIQYVGF